MKSSAFLQVREAGKSYNEGADIVRNRQAVDCVHPPVRLFLLPAYDIAQVWLAKC